MSDYNKIKSQFNQFIQSLKPDELTAYEIKLINLFLGNFDSVASVGTAQGKRASLINDLINVNRNTVSEELKKIEEKATQNIENITKLNVLEVENFRGFASKETFQLDKPKVLVYGPNGSGKTSFCEALEFSLLGYLSEAEAKRMDVRQYVTNVYTQLFTQPVITGINSKNEIVNLSHNPDSYYFCFIEKNRIIDFARYSSKTQGQQENLLATLFGLDEFYSFVNGFTENISGKIPIESVKQNDLDKKTLVITGQKQNIVTSTKKLAEIEKQKRILSEKYKVNKTFEELDFYTNGNLEQKGRIDLIDEELQKPQGKSFQHSSVKDLFDSIINIEKTITLFETNNTKFEQEKDKISFRSIFQLVQNFEITITDKCPVCETLVEQTTINPYDNARIKLKELEGIAEIELNRDTSWNNLVSEGYSFSTEFEIRKKCATEFQIDISINIAEQLKEFQKGKSESKAYIEDLKNLLECIKQQKELLLTLEQKINESNTKTNQHLATVKSFQDEKNY
jgi:DNA sulfur modification protein DndD